MFQLSGFYCMSSKPGNPKTLIEPGPGDGTLTYLSGIMAKVNLFHLLRIIKGLYYPKKVKGYLLYY